MQYKLELIHRNRPNNRFGLTLTIETDIEQYINSYQSVFNDDGINEFLSKLHEYFIMIAFESKKRNNHYILQENVILNAKTLFPKAMNERLLKTDIHS